MTRALGPPLTPDESAALVAACRSQLNVRFRHAGRKPGTGFDCAGLIAWGLLEIGKPIADRKGYGREPYRDGLRETLLANFGPPVPVEDLQAGDVALMTFAQEPRHVGLLFDHPGGGLAIVHTYGTVKRVVEHSLNAQWRGWITEVFRP